MWDAKNSDLPRKFLQIKPLISEAISQEVIPIGKWSGGHARMVGT